MADGGLLESIAPFGAFWDTRNTAGLEGIALTIRSYSRQSGFFLSLRIASAGRSRG